MFSPWMGDRNTTLPMKDFNEHGDVSLGPDPSTKNNSRTMKAVSWIKISHVYGTVQTSTQRLRHFVSECIEMSYGNKNYV